MCLSFHSILIREYLAIKQTGRAMPNMKHSAENRIPQSKIPAPPQTKVHKQNVMQWCLLWSHDAQLECHVPENKKTQDVNYKAPRIRKN